VDIHRDDCYSFLLIEKGSGSMDVDFVNVQGVVSTLYSGLAFNGDNAICVDKNGNIYVACAGLLNQNNSVVEVNTSGVATTLSTSADFPIGIVINSAGNIFFDNSVNPFGSYSVYGDISMLAAK
jgi:hypothetical protein